MKSLWKWIKCWLLLRPHLAVGGFENPYMLRWYILPRNPWFNIYLHKFLRDDDDRALHDHPWSSLSLIVRGKYREITPKGVQEYAAGSIILRSAEYSHRIELITKTCWTLFITGRRVREWGFHCPQGWRHWKDFTAGKNEELVGKGCD